jgi:hypothetical protein
VERKYLIIEDRFGYISRKVPRIFKPQLIVKNLASEYIAFLKNLENPQNFPFPPVEVEFPHIEGYEPNVFFRLAYTNIEQLSPNYRIVDFKKMVSPLVEFEMKFLTGRVPFADLSVVYFYSLENIEG